MNPGLLQAGKIAAGLTAGFIVAYSIELHQSKKARAAELKYVRNIIKNYSERFLKEDADENDDNVALALNYLYIKAASMLAYSDSISKDAKNSKLALEISNQCNDLIKQMKEKYVKKTA
jgi:1,2-phenylacetyl-CoA epoxidase catalytic subunit